MSACTCTAGASILPRSPHATLSTACDVRATFKALTHTSQCLLQQTATPYWESSTRHAARTRDLPVSLQLNQVDGKNADNDRNTAPDAVS